MPSKTRVIWQNHQKHGDVVLEEVEGMLRDRSLRPADINFNELLEMDFGTNARHKMMNLDQSVLEQIITSKTFDALLPRIIRQSLSEQPPEDLLVLSQITPESGDECGNTYRDWGVFSDPEVTEIAELEKAPNFGIAKDYMDHPTGKSWGLGLEFTREALCRDPNRYIQQQIPKIANSHNRNVENILLDFLIGYKGTYNRSGTYYDTYLAADGTSTPFSSGAGGPWVNALAMDFTCPGDLDTIKNLFYDFRDPVHGRPIDVPMSGLSVVTSKQYRDYLTRKMSASQIEEDVTCGDGQVVKYVMSPAVANGGVEFSMLPGYQRFVDRIVARYNKTAAEAREWWFLGNIPEFLGWTWNIRPTVTRCPLGAEEVRRRIVASYTSLSSGYAYTKNPMRGMMIVPPEASG